MTKWIKVLAVLCMWMALPTGCLAQEYYRVSDVYKQVQEKWKAEYKDSQGVNCQFARTRVSRHVRHIALL